MDYFSSILMNQMNDTNLEQPLQNKTSQTEKEKKCKCKCKRVSFTCNKIYCCFCYLFIILLTNYISFCIGFIYCGRDDGSFSEYDN